MGDKYTVKMLYADEFGLGTNKFNIFVKSKILILNCG